MLPFQLSGTSAKATKKAEQYYICCHATNTSVSSATEQAAPTGEQIMQLLFALIIRVSPQALAAGSTHAYAARRQRHH